MSLMWLNLVVYNENCQREDLYVIIKDVATLEDDFPHVCHVAKYYHNKDSNQETHYWNVTTGIKLLQLGVIEEAVKKRSGTDSITTNQNCHLGYQDWQDAEDGGDPHKTFL